MSIMPIINLNNQGVVVNTFHGAPCVRVAYSFEKPTISANGRHELTGLKRCLALIDTGADWNCIHEDLIPPHATAIEEIVNEGVGGLHKAKNYAFTLHPDGVDCFHSAGVISMPRTARPFDIILGRKFLQCTRFVWDGCNGIVQMEYFPNPEAI